MSARSGGEIARLPLGEAATLRAGAPYWVMHRADLQAALQAQVDDHPDIELRLGCQFEDAAPHAKGLTVVQRSGMTRQQEVALALVGADGIWSTVRHHLFPEVQPQFSGLIAWRGTLEATAIAARIHLAPCPALDGSECASGRLSDLRRATDQRGGGGAGDLEQAGLERARRDHRNQECLRVGAVAGHRADDDRCRRRVAEMGAVHRSRRRRVDRGRDRAARGRRPRHAAVCGAGRGNGDRGCGRAGQMSRRCCRATGAPALSAALQRYARLRRARVLRVQRAARQAGRIYHLTGPAAFARDLAIKAIGGKRLLARQDWIYGWRP